MSSVNFTKTGNPSVDFLAEHPVKGDVIPPNLFKLIKKDSGNTDMLAIMIFSNIIYWHRPTEVYDASGAVVGYKKKFSKDLLQKSYGEYAEMYDVTKRQVKASFDVLEKLGFIKRHFRMIRLQDGTCINNILFIELCNDKLPMALGADSDLLEEDISNDEDTILNKGYDLQIFVTPPTKKCDTNTNINPNNLTNNYLSIIHSTEQDGMDEGMTDEQVYREILLENTELESIIKDQPCYEDEYREYFEIMVDLVCHNKQKIKVHGQYYSADMVKSRMLKLKREHLEYVSSVYDDYKGTITDFYKHCAATLYNSYFEAGNVVSTKARNSLYTISA